MGKYDHPGNSQVTLSKIAAAISKLKKKKTANN